MNINIPLFYLLVLLICAPVQAYAQDRPYYTGSELSNPASHDGQLSPVVGVHNVQVMRANREHPDASNGFGWTYNHQPMLAYWNGKYYLEYLSDEVGEHIPPSQTFLMTSEDGYSWKGPVVLFPPYDVPDGFTKPENKNVAKGLQAIMHQRVGFYVSTSDRLIAMGYYGIALDDKDDPNDGNGIGRVVREIRKDGSLGPIYFIRYNHQFNEENTHYPYFEKSRDREFVKACREILNNPLYMMQWVEESDRNDPLIPLKKQYKAFSYYHLPDSKVVGLWKHALTSVSNDGGKTWLEPVERAKGFINSNAKIWGQRLSDGTYATVYNPAEFRWPLAISLSSDGLEYKTLNLVHGEITPMRYGGNYKSYGPQYVRGIQEGNGTPPDGDLWVTYSVNKEDMWVSRIPVPVRLEATAHANDQLNGKESVAELSNWNIYSPIWAPVSLGKKNGHTWLVLKDKDPFDYAKIERKIPKTAELGVTFKFMTEQISNGTLQIEFLDENGIACSRLEFTPEGFFRAKGGARFSNMMHFEPNREYEIRAELSASNNEIQIYVDDKRVGVRRFFAPVHSIERIVFRTGEIRQHPSPETPADNFEDLPNAGAQDPLVTYYIRGFQTVDLDKKQGGAILRYDSFSHYADYFNRMEDENIAQAISNNASGEWMKRNIPLFECPQKNFEEIYYFRWWSLRKHIKETPIGYVMTEFLVNRSYADKYNMIACAFGHHIYESRWLRDPQYLDQYIHAWYRGNEGKPMGKFGNFSSWAADAIYNRYLVDKDTTYLVDLLPDLHAEYQRWEESHRLPNKLFWQGDVQDGMEESISGGRRKKYARPTINSYMYGNADALAKIFSLTENEQMAKTYQLKRDTIKELVTGNLWNDQHAFFETHRGDSLANVREAIGYIPWYFNLPDNGKYDVAWKQVSDESGFLAPYGLTTAERRHPLFRMAGCCKCEWDGAIWPFATSQTMTAMANFMNNYTQNTVSDSTYFRLMERYVESQYHRGRPYIGEYQDEITGYWLKGDQERSRYYNHSTFNDLIITGLIGLRPQEDNTLVVNPLLPEDTWNWFCLDNVPYHGRMITILWDKYGDRYHQGKGFIIFVDGVVVGKSTHLEKMVCEDVL
ncbi:MGH1-like glycoside hydrolase domain-containing protein [Proteiniphilum sp. UBA1028]|uniref:MGH1-like glycoside hydrolase domain-containing protein n=1 Tax=Proteiniphilum sp. UBA1028 TaxID=1947251 RepID=UPI0025D49B26|nr:exo-alpha-sialidase [Proteiniphilum sp. UBA1028]